MENTLRKHTTINGFPPLSLSYFAHLGCYSNKENHEINNLGEFRILRRKYRDSTCHSISCIARGDKGKTKDQRVILSQGAFRGTNAFKIMQVVWCIEILGLRVPGVLNIDFHLQGLSRKNRVWTVYIVNILS